MPRLSFACPRADREGAKAPAARAIELGLPLPSAVTCPACAEQHALHLERMHPSGGLLGCLACGHPELFTQKDFPRSVGLLVVLAAALAAPATRYLSLAVAALIDALLHRCGPDVVVCYVCAARHRGFPREPRHPSFDREIAERLEFGERAVMGKPMRPGGSAGAPEPEH